MRWWLMMIQSIHWYQINIDQWLISLINDDKSVDLMDHVMDLMDLMEGTSTILDVWTWPVANNLPRPTFLRLTAADSCRSSSVISIYFDHQLHSQILGIHWNTLEYRELMMMDHDGSSYVKYKGWVHRVHRLYIVHGGNPATWTPSFFGTLHVLVLGLGSDFHTCDAPDIASEITPHISSMQLLCFCTFPHTLSCLRYSQQEESKENHTVIPVFDCNKDLASC